jgi:futalosine hydrolase
LNTNFQGLIVAATAKEIAPFIEAYGEQPAYFGNWDILITGPGLAATTYHLTKYLSLKKPHTVIMAGIAGGFDVTLPLGKVFLVKEDRIADEGVYEKGELKTLVEMGLVKKDQFPFNNGWLKNNNELLKKPRLKKVRAVTVNQVTARSRDIELYRKTFDPAIESMEGAALHYVCLLENIPFLQLRAISNYIGERNKKNWNFKDAINNLNRELIELINTL